MITQYPDILTYQVQDAGTFDNDGNPIAGGLGDVVELKCRAEVSSGNGIVKNVDGETINYSWIIYLPLGQEGGNSIPVGTKVNVVSDRQSVFLTDTVKRFWPGQLNARIWL